MVRIYFDKLRRSFYISDKEIKLRTFNGNELIRICEGIFEKIYDKNDKEKKNMVKRLKMSDIFPENLDPPFGFEFEDYAWVNFYDILLG